jgi:hypothetical protein
MRVNVEALASDEPQERDPCLVREIDRQARRAETATMIGTPAIQAFCTISNETGR